MESASVSGITPQAASQVSAAVNSGKVQASVAKNALDVQKMEGALVVDMIQKAGSVIDVTA